MFPGAFYLTCLGPRSAFLFPPASVSSSLVLSRLVGIRNAFFTPVCLSVFIFGLKTPFSIPFCRQPTAEGLLKVVRPSAAEWHYTSLKPHLYAEGRALFGRPSAIKSQTFRAKSSCRFSPAAREQKRRICSRGRITRMITGTRSAFLFPGAISLTCLGTELPFPFPGGVSLTSRGTRRAFLFQKALSLTCPGTESAFSFPGGVSLTSRGTRRDCLFQEALSLTCPGTESAFSFPEGVSLTFWGTRLAFLFQRGFVLCSGQRVVRMVVLGKTKKCYIYKNIVGI